MFKVIKGIRAGYEVIRPGTFLEKLPSGWNKDRLLRTGAIEEIRPKRVEAVVDETALQPEAVATAPVKPAEKTRKPAGKTVKKKAGKGKAAEAALPPDIDPSLMAGE